MIDLACRVFERGLDVLALEIGIAFEDFRFARTAGQHVEHVFDADAHAPDARPSATLVGIERDSVHLTHAATLRIGLPLGKLGVLGLVGGDFRLDLGPRARASGDTSALFAAFPCAAVSLAGCVAVWTCLSMRSSQWGRAEYCCILTCEPATSRHYPREVFETAGAAQSFMEELAEGARRRGWRLQAYALMRNQFLVSCAVPASPG